MYMYVCIYLFVLVTSFVLSCSTSLRGCAALKKRKKGFSDTCIHTYLYVHICTCIYAYPHACSGRVVHLLGVALGWF